MRKFSFAKMKVEIYCLLLIGLIGIVFAETYTNKFDNVDIDQILKNDRLLKNYVNCVLDKGKCSPDGAELKSEYPVTKILNIFKQLYVTFA